MTPILTRLLLGCLAASELILALGINLLLSDSNRCLALVLIFFGYYMCVMASVYLAVASQI